MRKSFSSLAALFILLASFVLTGCPKKAPSVEGSAGLSREKSETSQGEPSGPSDTKPIPPPPQEEKMAPLAKEDSASDGPSGSAGGGEATSLQDVFFDFDQWVIRPESRKLLESDAQWLAANPKAKIQIEGHADERGTEEYNLALGERRAKSVMNFLVNLGVSPSRLSSISYGEEKPFCNDPSEDCYAKNRRAHFVTAPR
ncbi:MAG: peptidoglycan-associated lipoprotein Pal [Candidatus Manganitrophaceae bacterium]|nr:MAG: peptidoglycan-associated lipoprotein Pal [Candidatus Manganitrophaceae bacterium]